ncbi:hypothetical protein Hanom_Chr16g01486271 [Helianthus anomalus]
MISYLCLHTLIVNNYYGYTCCGYNVPAHMSLYLESELSDIDNPTATATDNEIASASEIFTSDTESDPDMLTKDEDDFQQSALPGFGDDLPLLMASLTRILLSLWFQSMTTSPLVIPMVNTPWLRSSTMRLLWTFLPKTRTLLLISLLETPVNKLSSYSSMHSFLDSFESVTSAALQTAGLQLSTTDADDDAVMTAALSPARGTTPLHDPEPDPKLASAPVWVSLMMHLMILSRFLILTMFLLVYQTMHPLYLTQYLHLMIFSFVETFVFAPATVDVAPLPLWRPTSNALACLSFSFKTYPHPGRVLQVSTHVTIPIATATFSTTPQAAPFPTFTSTSLDEPFRWFLSCPTLILDPYQPPHYGSYTRDELFLLLQLQFKDFESQSLGT